MALHIEAAARNSIVGGKEEPRCATNPSAEYVQS
jgi:hypothetical protein